MAKNKAFDASTFTGFYMEPTDLVLISDEKHPLYDPRVNMPLEEKWVLYTMKFGITDPITITKEENGKPLVVKGRQRTKYCIEANKRLATSGAETWKVPCIYERGGDDDRLVGLMLGENEIRRGDDLLVKAKKIQRYMAMGHDEADAALVFGCSVNTVKNRLALLDLDGSVQKAVEEGAMNVTMALELSKLPPAEQQARAKAARDAAPAPAEAGERTIRVVGAGHAAAGKAMKRRTPSRPGVKTLKRIVDDAPVSDEVQTLLRWIIGEIDLATVSKKVRGLGFLSEKAEKKAKKAEKKAAKAGAK
jgi:ParB family chromosome partitioning protein